MLFFPNCRIAIERAAIAVSPTGETADAWQPLAGPVWADRRPLSGKELHGAAQLVATELAAFTVRWSSALADVSPRDRINEGGRLWDVKAAYETGRRDGLEIIAERRADVAAA